MIWYGIYHHSPSFSFSLPHTHSHTHTEVSRGVSWNSVYMLWWSDKGFGADIICSDPEISVLHGEELRFMLNSRLRKRKWALDKKETVTASMSITMHLRLLAKQMTWRRWLPVGRASGAQARIGQTQKDTAAPRRTLSDSAPAQPRPHPGRMVSTQARLLAVILVFISSSSSSSHAQIIPRVTFPLGKIFIFFNES